MKLFELNGRLWLKTVAFGLKKQYFTTFTDYVCFLYLSRTRGNPRSSESASLIPAPITPSRPLVPYQFP